MSGSWKLLAKTLGSKAETRSRKTAIVCAPTVESLKQFEARCLPNGCNFANTTMSVLGFSSAEVDIGTTNKRRREILELDAYAISFPITAFALDYLTAFVDLKNADDYSISWFFVLDWAMPNQRFWLQELISSVDVLSSSGACIPAGSMTICCVNTDHIYTWQKNTTQWLPEHVEHIQQALRSFCLLKKCSLLYYPTLLPSSALSDSDKEAALNVLLGKLDLISADLVSTSDLRVPWGSDSIDLIKRAPKSFEPSQVFTNEFKENFEAFIPRVVAPSARSDEMPMEQESIAPLKIDVQQELQKIYDQVQKHK
ncbi:hypothetical protein HG536_0A00450 [Torulaspora globosa]|uniref:Dynein light intermediate chain n=1 Tax=Torulaspora globosa TaxID=48254 RepID=A0A7G3Z9P2_9SACH|nr:uncharacterized protein HG536_0A00450 [Torulaspora globosa]QLL30228.1 hypothetical protein HG536_0A00450 [Torulaspora globosa]